MTFLIGLTGSIGMGKSVLAAQARRLGMPVHDADAAVRRLLAPGGAAVDAVARRFPDAALESGGGIDRPRLGAIVFADPKARRDLEAILHPLVRADSNRFVKICRRHARPLCILDIPLLFETGRNKDMDHILCATAPKAVQRRRVLRRPGMDEKRFSAIVKSQMPDYRKRMQSDTVIVTARGRRHTLEELKRLDHTLRKSRRHGHGTRSLGHPACGVRGSRLV